MPNIQVLTGGSKITIITLLHNPLVIENII